MRKLTSLLALALIACQTTLPAPEGLSEEGLTSWLGLEYATAERWELPDPGPDWTPTGSYFEKGPACPQPGQETMQEDCLFLNVFAPTEADDLPVIVWIHGGGFKQGEGGDYIRAFSKEGFVTVSFNYRLGKLGFHDWPGWTEADPRNFGQADMVMALRWVQRNIARFGGDPDRVTLMGHSAGAMGVQLMMVDERAKGLFQKAVAHSGYAAWPFPQAFNPTDEERQRIKYGPLRLSASPDTLVAEVPNFHLPYIGGSDLSAQPLTLFQSGQSGTVSYLTGANTHDGLGTLQGAGFSTEFMMDRYGESPEVRAAYAADLTVSEDLLAERLFGDMRYVYAARETARAHQGPAQLFLLDGPGTGHNHVEHYETLFGPERSAFRDLIVDFAKADPDTLKTDLSWQVLMSDGSTGDVGALNDRLDVIATLEFPKP